jgi:hypothetical protein
MGKERTTSSLLIDDLDLQGPHAPRTARRILQQLVKKKLLQCSKEVTEQGQVVCFWPPSGGN